MGLMYSRLRQCCGKIKQSPQGPEYRQVSQMVPPMELGGKEEDVNVESDFEAENNEWVSKETAGNKARIGIVVDRNEPTTCTQQQQSSPTAISASSSLANTHTNVPLSASFSQRSPSLQQIDSFSSNSVRVLGIKPTEEPEKPDTDFFSNMGMGISYAAPKRAIVKKVTKSELTEPTKPSAAFTMDSLLPDTFVESGWGGDSSLEIDIPKEKPERKTNNKRVGFASVVEIDNDIELDF